MVSYEVALGFSIIGVLMLAGTLSLVNIVEAQRNAGVWYVFLQPIGFILFFICGVAETNRAPFDLQEAESELVAGFHTEYSALKFALFFMAEYINMFTVSMLATVLFLGGWNGPGVNWLIGNGHNVIGPLLGLGYFLAKVFGFLFFYIWVRGTLPRFRFDQLMNFGWKFLLPVALINIVLTATLQWSGLIDWIAKFTRY